MAPRVHPVSLLVFLVGLTFGIVGITLAIVFGVKNSGTCPKCPDVQPVTCSAKLFTIRTGVKDLDWDEDLLNPNSTIFKDAQEKVSNSLMEALNSPSSSSAIVLFSGNAASESQSYEYVVTVTSFRQASDGNVVAFASGAATGSDPSKLPHDLEGSVQDKLTNHASTANVTDPAVNDDSMHFCLQPNTNIGVTGTPPSNGDLTTVVPCDVTTCATLIPECPSTHTPTVCPTTTCPEVNASTCKPYTCPSLPTTGPTCPTPEPCPTTCPNSTVTPNTCPTPPPCPTVCPSTPAPTCPTPDPCPLTCPTPSAPSCPTCPTLDATTCAPFTPSCPSTASPPTCPSPAPCSTTCPECPVVTGPTVSASTCPPPPECPTPLTSGATCPPPPICPSPTTCPPPPECPTPLTSGATCPPPPTCPSPTTCPPPPECPTPMTSGATCPPPPTCPSPTTCPTPPECPTPLTSGATCPPPLTCPSPTTCPTCPECPTTPFWTQTQGSTTTPLTPGTVGSTTSVSSTSTLSSTGTTQGQTTLFTGTSTLPTTGATQGQTTLFTGTTISLPIGTTPGQTTPFAETSTVSQTTAAQRSTTAFTGTTPTGATSTQGYSSSSQSYSSTVMTTTEMETTTTTTPPCYGKQYFYGNLAVVFEHTNEANQQAQDAQNVMMNTFITLQLVKYDGYLIDRDTTRTLPVPYPDPTIYGSVSQSFQNAMTSTDQINGTISYIDIASSVYAVSSDAKIDDGLQFVLGAQAQDRPEAVIIVGISDKFVDAAKDSAAALKQKGYSVFTVALNGTGDLSSLASDPSFAYDLKNPKAFDKAEAIATSIGDSILSLSPICIGGTPPTTPPPTTTPIITSTVSTTPTTPSCPMKFLTNDIAFVFENSLDAQNSVATSNLSANYLSSYLIPRAMSDLQGSGTWSNIVQFALVDFPNPAFYPNLWGCCDFGKVTQASYAAQLQTMIIAENALRNTSTPDSMNDGLVYANNQFLNLNDGKKLSVVLFANSADGVAAATATAQSLRDAGNAVVTVAVGGKFDLSPLSTDNSVHYLDSSTNKDSLTTEILSVLQKQGTVCCDATHCF